MIHKHGPWLSTVSICVALTATSLLTNSLLAQGKKKDGGAAYQIVTLAPPNTNAWRSGVGDLNEAGTAVGFYEEMGGSTRAFCYNATTEAYATLSGGSAAMGINNAGRIVGEDDSAGLRIGLYWHSVNASPLIVPPLTGDMESRARDVNDAGIITGVSIGRDTADGRDLIRAAAWKVEVGESVTISDPVDLGVLPGDSDTEAYRLNELNSGGIATIVGNSSRTVLVRYDDNARPIYDFVSLAAVTWTVGINQSGNLVKLTGPVDLGTPLEDWSDGLGVNNLDDACGERNGWPFLKLARGVMEPLTGVRNATGGAASDVNDLQDVVGHLQVSDKRGSQLEHRAILWQGTSTIDLTKQIGGGTNWQLLEHALDVNNAGYVAGVGQSAAFGSGKGAFLLIPSE